MEFKTIKYIFLITFAVILYAAVMNLSSVLVFLQSIAGIISPIILGLVFAFILNVPVSGLERKLERILHRPNDRPERSSLRSLSLALTLAGIALIITLAFTIAIPELVTSAKSIYPLLKEE